MLEQPLGELPCTVGAEVEEDRGVEPRQDPWPAANGDRLDELVGHAPLVALANGTNRIVGLRPSQADGGERAVGALPPSVAVHRVVAAADGGDSLGGELGQIVHGTRRGDVAAVREGVDPRPLLHPFAAGELEQRAEVVDVRVHPAVGHEAEEMYRATTFLRAAERAQERLVGEERPVLDRACHPHEILVEDPAGPDRQVADFRVAHLAVREPDRRARRCELRVRIARPQPVKDGCLCQLDGVARPGRRAAPTVEDDERYQGHDARYHAAAVAKRPRFRGLRIADPRERIGDCAATIPALPGKSP